MEYLASKQPVEQHLTVKEFACCVGVHPQTVRRWLKDGKIKDYLQYGRCGHYRIHKSSLWTALPPP